jgi:hypothetical protein
MYSMEVVAWPGEAVVDTIVFSEYFKDLPDGRQSAKVKHPLDEALLCLPAVIAGAETITDIVRLGEKKRDLLRRYRPFREGAPAHDHLGDILAALDAEPFQRCFAAWAASLIGAPEGRTDHAPANLTTIKHIALNLIPRAPGKDSMRHKRKVAAWDDDFLAATISA